MPLSALSKQAFTGLPEELDVLQRFVASLPFSDVSVTAYLHLGYKDRWEPVTAQAAEIVERLCDKANAWAVERDAERHAARARALPVHWPICATLNGREHPEIALSIPVRQMGPAGGGPAAEAHGRFEDLDGLRDFLRRVMFGLPPGRSLEVRDENAPRRHLPASVAKRQVIEIVRDLAEEDAGFARLVAPVLEEFSGSLGYTSGNPLEVHVVLEEGKIDLACSHVCHIGSLEEFDALAQVVAAIRAQPTAAQPPQAGS